VRAQDPTTADALAAHLDVVGSEDQLLRYIGEMTAAIAASKASEDRTASALEKMSLTYDRVVGVLDRIAEEERRKNDREERAAEGEREHRMLKYERVIGPIVSVFGMALTAIVTYFFSSGA
jgi:hypothetical protein